MNIENELRRLIAASPRDDGPCRQLFEHFDADGSGTISLEELQQVASSWSEPLTNQELTSLMKEVDTNKDGEIDYGEFRQFILGLSSFDKHHRSKEFQSAYQKWTQAMHSALGIPLHDESGSHELGNKVLSRNTINPCIEKMRCCKSGQVRPTVHAVDGFGRLRRRPRGRCLRGGIRASSNSAPRHWRRVF